MCISSIDSSVSSGLADVFSTSSHVERVQQSQKGPCSDVLQSGDPSLAEDTLSPQGASTSSLISVDPRLGKGYSLRAWFTQGDMVTMVLDVLSFSFGLAGDFPKFQCEFQKSVGGAE